MTGVSVSFVSVERGCTPPLNTFRMETPRSWMWLTFEEDVQQDVIRHGETGHEQTHGVVDSFSIADRNAKRDLERALCHQSHSDVAEHIEIFPVLDLGCWKYPLLERARWGAVRRSKLRRPRIPPMPT